MNSGNLSKHALVILLLAISFGVITVAPVCAQDISGTEDNSSLLSLGLTSDAFGGLELGYSDDLLVRDERSVLYYVQVSLPLFLTVKSKKLNAWELKAGVKSEVVTRGKMSTRGNVQLYIMNHEEVLGHFIPVGINIGLTPCYNFPKGYLGLQIAWNQSLWTYITHSQYTRNSFQDIPSANNDIIDIHPTDGWYAGTGSHFNIGVEGYRQMSPRISLYGDMGLTKYSALYSGLFDAMMIGQVPFYGNLGLFYNL